MAKQVINIGTAVNSGNGDPIRTAFNKANENFTELYTAVGTIPTNTNQLTNGSGFITASDIPNIPADVSDLTDTEGLLGQGSGNIFDENGVLQLPDGGTIAEGVVTENPTIELTPANPEAESQKLVIKGGGPGFSNSENGISITTYNLNVASGDTAFFEVYANQYANEQFYWWVDGYSPGQEFAPDNGVFSLDEFGFAAFSLEVLNSSVPLKVYVADTLYNAYVNNKGVGSVIVNGEPVAPEDLYHLHLTTGDLTETSIILGTDEHNVRTKIDGSVELTSYDYDNQQTYRLNFKNNVLKISSTDVVNDEDLYIKAEDDLYLDALDDDIHIRANDDIRLRSGYDFENDVYNYELRFTDSGTLVFYNYNDDYDYGYVRMYVEGEGGPRTLAFEGDQNVVVATGYGNVRWTFNTEGVLTLPAGGDIKNSNGDSVLDRNVLSTVSKTGTTATNTGEVATVSVSPSNNPNLTPGAYQISLPVLDVGSFAVEITVAENGDISGVVTNSPGGFTVGTSVVTVGVAVGGTTGVDDITTTVESLTNIVQATALDLTKSVQKLTDGFYTLANGVEGQIMYLVRQPDAGPEVAIIVANGRVGNNVYTNIAFLPFSGSGSGNMTTLIFTDGAWQADNGAWD
jgi:hypothetical protein